MFKLQKNISSFISTYFSSQYEKKVFNIFLIVRILVHYWNLNTDEDPTKILLIFVAEDYKFL